MRGVVVPLVLVEGPVPNNFDYESDTAGAKCPFQAHIRKTNPRGGGVCPTANEPTTRTVTADPFPQAVTLKGDDYFFMPSLTFPRGLGGKG